MTANTTHDRLTDPTSRVADVVFALAGGNPGAINVLIGWINSSPTALFELLILDTKRLYDHRIWELYKYVCGEDIERFKYHVQVELPNQETGELSVTGPYSPDFDDQEFWQKRRFGQPGSFWALENPPSTADYAYPIR